MNKDILKLIERRRKQMLVHSYIYYQLDDCIVNDYTWSEWAKELYDLQNEYPEESEKAYLYEDFKDFDYSTGADLPFFKYPWVQFKAQILLDYSKHNFDEKLDKWILNYGKDVLITK